MTRVKTWARFMLRDGSRWEVPWVLLSVLSLSLLVGGLVGTLVAILPVGLGDPDWELAAFGEMAATMALPALGSGMLAVISYRRGIWWGVAAAGLVLLLLALMAATGALLVGLNAALVWGSRLPFEVLTQLKVATTKAILLSVVYAVGFGTIGILTLRHSLTARGKQ